MVANDEEQIAYARSLEVAALQYPGAECRITDDHVAREVVPPAYTRYLGTCLADLLASPA